MPVMHCSLADLSYLMLREGTTINGEKDRISQLRGLKLIISENREDTLPNEIIDNYPSKHE